jgi:uracil-DNA glycosylase family 4
MSKAPGALCVACTLRECEFVPTEVHEDAKLLFIGEAPGAEEVRYKRPFIGMSGQLLEGAIKNAGHTREEASYANVVACRPPQNRAPTTDEVQCCVGRLNREIEAIGPETIVLLGKTASEAVAPLLPDHRGTWHKFSDTDTDIIGTWHPAYVLRKPGEATAFLSDVRKAFEGPLVHVVQRAPECRVVNTFDELATVLSTTPSNSWVAYDLETNQTTWYRRPGQGANSILMMGLTWDEQMGVIIGDELLYDDPRTKLLLKSFFDDMRPVGHNIKFDNVFLRSHIGLDVKADFDTMLAHYILDENSKHGLKELASEEFGIPDYEKELISPYLRNKNDEYSKVPFEQMAPYCCWDVAATLALRKLFDGRLVRENLFEWPFDNIIMPAQEAFTTMELRGIQVDIDYLQQCAALYDRELVNAQIRAGALVGMPDINLNSSQQVGGVLWDMLKLPQSHSRRVKPRSTDKEAVLHLRGKHPFVDELMRYRRLAKLKSSYIDNMIEFADVNQRIHPSALLWGTEMGRISMRNPAVQCVTGDTYIWTENGLTTAKDMFDAKRLDTFPFNASTSYRSVKPAKCVKVTLESELTITCTPEHPINTTDGWVRADELTPEHSVPIVLAGQFGSAVEKDALIAGILVANGFKQNREAELDYWALHCSTLDPYVLEILKSYGFVDTNNPGDFALYGERAVIAHLLSFLPDKSGAHNKEVPKSIMMSDRDSVLAFLRGLTCDSTITCYFTGREQRRIVAWNTISEKLCQQTRQLLLMLGYLPLVTKSPRKNPTKHHVKNDTTYVPYTWRTELSGGEAVRFVEEIGGPLMTRHRETVANPDWYPKQIRPPRERAYAVRSVEPADTQTVYDFTVDEYHMFIANGMTVHNTIPRPDDPERRGYDVFEDGAVIRGAIVAAPGNVVVVADYSQAELRVLAALSGEPFLLQAYRDERDIHSEVAIKMYGEHYSKEQRVKCKMFNFSYVYGGNEFSFAEDAGLPINIARQFVRDYDKLMPVALQYKKDQYAKLKEQGYVSTFFGRRRRFPLITSENQDEARKASVHAPVAGTASDLTLLALIRCVNQGIPVVLPVHDSIVTDSPQDRAEEHAEAVATAMMETGQKYLKDVPWKVDKEISNRWVKPPSLSQLEGGSM